MSLNQLNIHLSDFEKKRKSDFRWKYCLHPEASEEICGAIINAHTISKKATLKTIAEDGHVYVVRPELVDVLPELTGIVSNPAEILPKLEGILRNISPKKIGIQKASTFSGFCGKHDNELFKPIEQGKIKLDKESIFLLSYRAMAHEHYLKKANIRSLSGNNDKDLDPEGQAILSMHITKCENEVRESDILKAKYDNAFKSGDLSKFKYVAVRIDKNLPIVTSGGKFPDFDFERNALFNATENFDDPPIVQINIVNDRTEAIASIAWFNEDIRMNKFADSFLRIVETRGADFLVQLGITTCENNFFRISWWDKLDKQTQTAFSGILPSLSSWEKSIANPINLGLNGIIIEKVSSSNK